MEVPVNLWSINNEQDKTYKRLCMYPMLPQSWEDYVQCIQNTNANKLKIWKLFFE